MDPALTDDYVAMTWELRRAGIPAELYLGTAKGAGQAAQVRGPARHADRAPLRLEREGAGHRHAQGHGDGPPAAPPSSPTARSGSRSGRGSARCRAASSSPRCARCWRRSRAPADERRRPCDLDDPRRPRRRVADPRRARPHGPRPAGRGSSCDAGGARAGARRPRSDRARSPSATRGVRALYAARRRGRCSSTASPPASASSRTSRCRRTSSKQLQRNILLSHSVGVGENADADDLANYFPPDVVRAALAIRLNAFLKGHSGVRAELVEGVAGHAQPRHRAARAAARLGRLERRPLPAVAPLRRAPRRGAVLRGPRAGRDRGAAPLRRAAGRSPCRRSGRSPRSPRARDAAELQGRAGARQRRQLLGGDPGARRSTTPRRWPAPPTWPRPWRWRRSAAAPAHSTRGSTRRAATAVRSTAPPHPRSLLAAAASSSAPAPCRTSTRLRCAPQVHGAARDALAYARMVAEREINAANRQPAVLPEAGRMRGRALRPPVPRQLARGVRRQGARLLLRRQLPRRAGRLRRGLPGDRPGRAGEHLRAAHPDAARPPPQPEPPREPDPAARA